MAEEPKSSKPASPKPERPARAATGGFLASLVPDPANPPDCVLLGGYLGDSAEEGKSRLYLRPDLSDYLEIPSEAILHQQAILGEPLGAVHVWVLRTAKLTRKGRHSEEPVETHFL